jgi:phosphotransferase system  glucose/maltose/N-acetylglucosamine-specific IIC component
LYVGCLVSTIATASLKTFAKGEAHMDALNAVKSWIGALTEVVLMLLALAIVCAMLVGANLPFFGNVVANIMGLVGELGKNGLVGLIALGIILYLFAPRKMA